MLTIVRRPRALMCSGTRSLKLFTRLLCRCVRAGPRAELHFDPTTVKAAIVTCGAQDDSGALALRGTLFHIERRCLCVASPLCCTAGGYFWASLASSSPRRHLPVRRGPPAVVPTGGSLLASTRLPPPPSPFPGGLCPGLNDVIRQIVLTLDGGYGVTSITGA